MSYKGYDVNEKWKSIHSFIKNYKSSFIKKVNFIYKDIIEDEKTFISDANVIVLQYLISYFYNTNQIDKIDDFFEYLVKYIVKKKKEGEPFVVIINDVNSCYRGRNLFLNIIKILEKYNLHGHLYKFYFDFDIKNWKG